VNTLASTDDLAARLGVSFSGPQLTRATALLAEWSNPQGFKTAAAGAVSISLDGSATAGSFDDGDKAILDVYRRRRRSVQLSARLV
jgi:hypothetical protein